MHFSIIAPRIGEQDSLNCQQSGVRGICCAHGQKDRILPCEAQYQSLPPSMAEYEAGIIAGQGPVRVQESLWLKYFGIGVYAFIPRHCPISCELWSR